MGNHNKRGNVCPFCTESRIMCSCPLPGTVITHMTKFTRGNRPSEVNDNAYMKKDISVNERCVGLHQIRPVFCVCRLCVAYTCKTRMFAPTRLSRHRRLRLTLFGGIYLKGNGVRET